MTLPNRSNIDHPLAAKIDHTLLKPEATPDEVQKLCAEALEYGFASVCVNPCHVKLCAALLKGTSVQVCTVIGFPLGATTTAAKVSESRAALNEGATELDMVINIGFLKAGEDAIVKNDIASVVAAARTHGAITKVILETCLLNDAEKKRGCLLAKEAGADFVKTSTGFSKGGATAADIMLMRGIVGSSMGVKASGGVRTRQDAMAMIAAGATRIGASAGIAIVTEQQ